jgi:hypothetical protein
MELTHTVTLPELLWTMIGLLGLAVSALNLRDALKDVEALEIAKVNGALRMVARGNATEETLRVCKAAVISSIGVAAMLIPPAVPAAPVSPLAVIVTVGLFALSTLVVAGSVTARTRRVLTRRYALAEARATEKGE